MCRQRARVARHYTLLCPLSDVLPSCFPACGRHLVIVELAGNKDTTEILQRLNKAYPVADDEQQAGVQRLLGDSALEPVCPLSVCDL